MGVKSRTKRLHHAAKRTIYHRGVYIHGEAIGVFFGLLLLVVIAAFTLSPSIHADYSNFNPSTGDVGINYAIDQKPTFVVDANDLNGKISKTTVKTIDGKDANVSTIVSPIYGTNQFRIVVDPTGQTEVGHYKISVDIKNGPLVRSVSEEFAWGVLAFNLDKSTYEQYEPVTAGMAVLDDKGVTVCDSNISLEITQPNGKVTKLTSAKGEVKKTDTCKDRNITTNPDYVSRFTPELTGTYAVNFTATTKNGTRSYLTSFEVVKNAPFVTERTQTAMRLYPESAYQVNLQIHAQQFFDGTIQEKIPESFSIADANLRVVTASGQVRPQANTKPRTDVEGSQKFLRWDTVSMVPGDTAEVTYTYKAPYVSPAFYTVGPAKLTGDDGTEKFTEPRAWQLASDAAGEVILLWDTANGAIPSGWTCISCATGNAFYQVFPRGNSTYGTATGGSDTSTHTLTYQSMSAPTPLTVTMAAGNVFNTVGMANTNHTHTFGNPTIGAADIKPPYQNLQFIKASNPIALPANIIGMFAVDTPSQLPTNWASYAKLNDPSNSGVDGNGVYLRGENVNTTGGAATHVHTRTAVTSGAANGTFTGTTQGGTAVSSSTTNHTHTIAAGNTTADTNDPLFVTVVFAKLSMDKEAVPSGLMAFFDNTAMPSGWTQQTNIDTGTTSSAIAGNLIKGSLSAGDTGGRATHNHGGTQVYTTGAPSAAVTTGRTGTSQTVPSNTHTHNVTYSVSAGNSMPVYRDVIIGKYAGITISGTVYSDEGTTPLASQPIRMALNGTSRRNTTTAANGTFTMNMPDPGAGGEYTLWIDSGTNTGATITRTGGGNISGLDIYQNRLIVRHENSAGPITNTDIAKCTKTLGTSGVCADTDLHFDVASSNLTVDNDTRLYIASADTYTPGGTVTLSPRTALSGVGGDLKFGASSSTLNIGTNNLTVGGSWDNSVGGTFTKTSTQTTLLNGTQAGLTIASSNKNFDKLTINGSGGNWTFTTAATVDGDFAITNGTVTLPSSTLSLNGNMTNSGTFSHNSGMVQFTSTATGKTINSGGSSFNNVTFTGSGEWSPTSTLTAVGNLTVNAGTFDSVNGTSDVVVNGDVTCVSTCGTITMAGNTFTQRVSANENFGTTVGTNNWSFNNLTFSNNNGTATPVTVSTSTGGSGGVSVAGVLRVGASGDATGATTTLGAGNRSWTLSGTGGSPFQLLTSPTAVLSPGTSTFSYTGDNTSGSTTIQGATYYKLVINKSGETFAAGGAISAASDVNIAAGTLSMAANNLTVGSTAVTNSGTIAVAGTLTQTTPGTTTVMSSDGGTAAIGGAGTASFYNLSFTEPSVGTAPVFTLGTTTGQTITVSNNLTIGNGTGLITVNASTNNETLTVGGDVTINTNGTFVAPNSSSFTIGGSWANSGTFTPGTGTVTFNATAAGKTIDSGGTGTGKKFNKVVFNSGAGGWTVQTNNLTTQSDLTLTNISALTVQSGRTVEVDGTYSVCNSCTSGTSLTGSTLFLNSGTAYTVGSKTQSSEVYGTLKVGANTDIRTWNSGSTTNTVDPTGSLYSQNDTSSSGALKIYGDYHVTGSDYWQYGIDFDGTVLGTGRQVTVQVQPGGGLGVTIDSGGTLAVKGGGTGTSQFTDINSIGGASQYHLTNSGTFSDQEAKIANASFDGGTWNLLNTAPTNTSVTAGTLNVDWYLSGHLVDRDTPATNVQTASQDITVSETSSAATVFKEASSAWGSGAALQTTSSDSNGLTPQPNADATLRIREYSQTSSGPTYYNYNIAVSNQPQFANYNYQRDYGKYLTSTANTSSSEQKSIGSSWYRDTVNTPNADGTLNGAVPNGSWYIGSSKGIIGFWDTASGSIPTGWSCISCLSGDPFYQKFFRAASTYGSTGGSDTATHTLTYSSVTNSGPTFTAVAGSTAVSSGTYTNTYGNPTMSTDDIKPQYKDLQVIRGPVSGTYAWPANIIMPFNTATAPASWTAYTALDGKYVRGENDNATGGSATHTHTTSQITSGASVGTVNAQTCSTGCVAADSANHTHNVPATATTVANNDPLHVNVRFMKHNDTSAPPLRNLVGLFDYTSLPTGYIQNSSTAPYNNNLLVGSATSILGTGGSATHNHGGTMTITTTAENQASTNVTPGSGVTATQHGDTHNVTYNVGSGNSMPAYRDVVVSDYLPHVPPSSPMTLVQAKTDDTVLAAGAWTNTSNIKFSAQVTSANIDTQSLQLCVEKKAINIAFTNTEDACTAAGVSQAPNATVTATVTINGIAENQYHWQARVKDALGNYSAWVPYNSSGNNSTVDFGIDTTVPTVATVYDNTNLDAQPFNTDAQQNADGSLTTLSGSWADFDSTISGLNKYQYSIGKTAGATDIKAWTDNGTARYVRDSSLTLQTNQPYYINVRAIDNAGNTSAVASSDGQTVTPTLSFDIDVAATDQKTSPPYGIDFGTISPQTVYNSPTKIWVDFQTNGVAGGRVYIASANGGLKSTRANDVIGSSSGNLDSLNSGFGAQVTSAVQTSGGPFTYGSPFNGSGNSVGVLNSTFQSIFTASSPVTGGRGSLQLKLKSSNITKAANDYSDTLTIVAAGSY